MSSNESPLVFIPGIKASMLSRTQDRRLWLTWWQALGFTSADLRLPIIWDSDGQPQDDVVATSPLRTVAGQDIYASFLKWAARSRQPFYSFAYDWRRDNLETVDKFLRFMSETNENHGGQKPQVVAHSMGGLVAFVALNRRPDLFSQRPLCRRSIRSRNQLSGGYASGCAHRLQQTYPRSRRFIYVCRTLLFLSVRFTRLTARTTQWRPNTARLVFRRRLGAPSTWNLRQFSGCTDHTRHASASAQRAQASA
jgi:pimeloyl-ACP methyl ester carboxylesterase